MRTSMRSTLAKAQALLPSIALASTSAMPHERLESTNITGSHRLCHNGTEAILESNSPV